MSKIMALFAFSHTKFRGFMGVTFSSFYARCLKGCCELNKFLKKFELFHILEFSSLEKKVFLLKRENEALRGSTGVSFRTSHSTSPTPPSFSSCTDKSLLHEQVAFVQVFPDYALVSSGLMHVTGNDAFTKCRSECCSVFQEGAYLVICIKH